jgi:hypothetical protein
MMEKERRRKRRRRKIIKIIRYDQVGECFSSPRSNPKTVGLISAISWS